MSRRREDGDFDFQRGGAPLAACRALLLAEARAEGRAPPGWSSEWRAAWVQPTVPKRLAAFYGILATALETNRPLELHEQSVMLHLLRQHPDRIEGGPGEIADPGLRAQLAGYFRTWERNLLERAGLGAGRGRPSQPALRIIAREFEFDLDHYQRLRTMGWRNVPPNKQILMAVVARWFPGDPDPERRAASVKKALQRR